MSLTAFGVAFLCLAIVCFCRSYRSVAYFYAMSYLFQMTSVVNVGETGFAPYLFAPLLLILKGVGLNANRDIAVKNIQVFSFIFIAFVILQSLISAFLFSGNVMVYEGGGMETALAKGKEPFHFSFKSIIQWVYLILNMGALCSLLRHRRYLGDRFSTHIIVSAALLVTILGFWKYVADNFFGYFPSDFFFSSPTYNQGNLLQNIGDKFRFTSIFSEASVCSLALVGFWWNAYFVKIPKRKTLLLLLFMAFVLTVASTGIFSMLFGCMLFLIAKRNFRFLVVFGTFACVLYVVTSFMGIGDSLYQMTFEKTKSGSMEARSAIMYSGWILFKDTYGFGCGLGSSTASSLLFTLLGQVGFVGLFLFFGWLLMVFRFQKIYIRPMAFFPIVVILFGMVASVGYLSYPILWLQLIICTTLKTEEFVGRKL